MAVGLRAGGGSTDEVFPFPFAFPLLFCVSRVVAKVLALRHISTAIKNFLSQ